VNPVPTAPASNEERISPLERYMREQVKSIARWHPTLRMSATETGESFTTVLLGVHAQHHFILEAPKQADASLVDVREDDVWVFRSLHHRTALRFQARVLLVAPKPLPHLHVQLPEAVERRTVRSATRVPVALKATLMHSKTTPAMIIDLSVGGVRLAIGESSMLPVGQKIVFSIALQIQDRLYPLELSAVVRARDPAVAEHPGVAFYRMQFDFLSETAFLTLQAYLGTVVADELDSFWRMIDEPVQA
jgi:hypothetical protein